MSSRTLRAPGDNRPGARGSAFPMLIRTKRGEPTHGSKSCACGMGPDGHSVSPFSVSGRDRVSSCELEAFRTPRSCVVARVTHLSFPGVLRTVSNNSLRVDVQPSGGRCNTPIQTLSQSSTGENLAQERGVSGPHPESNPSTLAYPPLLGHRGVRGAREPDRFVCNGGGPINLMSAEHTPSQLVTRGCDTSTLGSDCGQGQLTFHRAIKIHSGSDGSLQGVYSCTARLIAADWTNDACRLGAWILPMRDSFPKVDGGLVLVKNPPAPVVGYCCVALLRRGRCKPRDCIVDSLGSLGWMV